MKVIRKSKTTQRLEDLERGMVFTLPDKVESFYMVINKHDCYIDKNDNLENEVMFIDLEDGEIHILDCDTEVIWVNGSFVINY